MTTRLLTAGISTLAQVLNAAVYDTGFAVGTVEPGATRGRGFPCLLAELLLACGRAQPSNTPTRQVTRADIGRITVAARAVQRDLVVFGSHQLNVSDANLLHLIAHRAEVDLWLVADNFLPPDIINWSHGRATRVSAEDALTRWACRTSAQQRRAGWPCDTYLQTSTTGQVHCERHRDVVDCVLEWFPHAFVTARVTPAQIRTCLFELTALHPESKWRVWARARDHYKGLMRALTTWDVDGADLAGVRLSALNRTATTLSLNSGIFTIPSSHRELVAAHRDVRLADGFAPKDWLFQVSAAHASRYAMLRPGDPRPQAA